MTIRFAAPIYPGGRICLLSGSVTVGAVFPPAGPIKEWTWSVRRFGGAGRATLHRAPTEQAAKNALLASWLDFVRAAGLQVVEAAE